MIRNKTKLNETQIGVLICIQFLTPIYPFLVIFIWLFRQKYTNFISFSRFCNLCYHKFAFSKRFLVSVTRIRIMALRDVMSRKISFDSDSQPLKGAETSCDFPISSVVRMPKSSTTWDSRQLNS